MRHPCRFAGRFVGRCLALLFTCTLSSPALAEHTLNEFWSLDEFLVVHPEQVPLGRAFAERVRAPARALSLEQARPIKISVISPGVQVSDYWRRNQEALEGRLKELGIRYRMQMHATRPEEDPRHQIQYLQKALKDEPDYLIFTLDTLDSRMMIERIIGRGKPKLILQNITTPIREWQDKQPFLYVGFDHVTGTRLLADYFAAHARGKTDYAMLYRAKGYVSSARGDSFIEMMKAHPQIRLRTAYYTEGDRSSAHKASLAALKEYPDLDFMYACATDTAMGIVDALKETGQLGRVRVNGWGGGSAELEALQRGELDVTVMRMNDDTGVAIAEAIGLDLRGQPVPTVYSGEFALIQKGISSARLSQLKARAFRYSGEE